MSNPAENYLRNCEDAVKHFLQSVVVIDNQAQLYEGEWGQSNEGRAKTSEPEAKALLRKPSAGLSSGQTHRVPKPKEGLPGETPDEASRVDTGAEESHVLRAWALTESLADKKILCTVYRPEDQPITGDLGAEDGEAKDHPIVVRSVKMACLADIVVLDWELGGSESDKGTWKAREIIKAILTEDEGKKGCQRLIAVYTAFPNLDAVYTDVVDDIGSIEYVGGRLTGTQKRSLSNRTTRIVFLNKVTVNTSEKANTTVSERSLPEHLIDEFLKLNQGLLPSIALHSIASIREATHHLLSTFHARLDPALLSHRSLLPDPRDSEEFVMDLIAGEIRSTLSVNRIGQKYANAGTHKDWIANELSDVGDFKFSDDITVTMNEAVLMVEKGQDEFEIAGKNAAKRWVDWEWAKKSEFRHTKFAGKLRKIAVKGLIDTVNLKDLGKHLKFPVPVVLGHDNLTNVFAGDAENGDKINNEFSRLSTLKREKYGTRVLPSDWLPRLTQGTIIREIKDNNKSPSNFLLCIQPRCDSVRLGKKGKSFPFLVLKGNGSGTRQQIIIRAPQKAGEEAIDFKVWISPFPYRQEMITFKPISQDAGYVEAVPNNKIWIFESDGVRYEWITDMKDFLAQKICDQLSGRQGTVGLDEYEWLRRFSHP